MKGKNAFGGGNQNSLYTPMSDVEQEVIDRLVASDDLELEIVDWGYIKELSNVTFGDLRVSIPFRLSFNKPEFPQPVHFFDLRLKTRTGLVLYQERMPTMYGGKPIQISAGVVLDLVWDIAIQQMDPKLVKAFKPHAFGLTSANFDKDTGSATLLGNRKLDSNKKRLLRDMRSGEAFVREDAKARIKTAVKKTQGK